MSHATAANTRPRGAVSAEDFALIADLVRARSGIVLGADKAYLVECRLQPVLRHRHLPDIAAIAAQLRVRPAGMLAQEVIEALTTNETLFFRDSRPFLHFREQALPALRSARPPGHPLRIWSAAASSGQEPYSIAISALEAGCRGAPLQIIATDIAAGPVARARQGRYSELEVRRGLTPQHLQRYFHKAEDGWQVNEAVRQMVQFRFCNLLDDLRPLGVFDAVFCRNVLIYFDVPTKRRVLQAVWQQMAPGGLLYMGSAETPLGLSDRFVPCPGAPQVYAAVQG